MCDHKWKQSGGSGYNWGDAIYQGAVDAIGEQWMQSGSSGCNISGNSGSNWRAVDPIGEQWIQSGSSRCNQGAADAIGEQQLERAKLLVLLISVGTQ